MKILVFAGSNSSQSINFQFANYASTFFNEANKTILNLAEFDLPVFGIDLEKEKGIPEDAYYFATKISESDLIILSLAEHNGSYTAAFKNLYDWISRIPNRKVFDDKPLLLLSTSPGERAGANVMAAALDRFPRNGANVMGYFSLPSFEESFDSANSEIRDNQLKLDFQSIIHEIKEKLA